MNVRYFHEFIGADDVLNRFEILTRKNVVPMEVEATDEPFCIEYGEVKRLEPVRGSQATLKLISEAIFQFTDLHTDDMQEFLLKFYRDGTLYWIGWLDAELYHENLSDFPPYPVEFSAADFNILERLKYRDEEEKAYTDIVPLLTHLKRCFNRLNLPFNKLYIGCSTIANGVPVPPRETILHRLYMMSANFYDEDNEPMTCREVVENILRPFGLMMVQKDANVYIYDYNTVKLGLPMMRYNFETLNYEQDETINFHLGNLPDIGFMSADSSYGFEEMINNVKITSSLYAANPFFDGSIKKTTLSSPAGTVGKEAYRVDLFSQDANVEDISGNAFIVYTNNNNENTIIGARSVYKIIPEVIASGHTVPMPITPLFRIKSKYYLLGTGGNKNHRLNVKVRAYANTRDNPFDTEQQDVGTDKTKAMHLLCNLYITDVTGKPLYYYRNRNFLFPVVSPEWLPATADGKIEQGQFDLFFCVSDVQSGNMINSWHTNANVLRTGNLSHDLNKKVLEKYIGKGVDIPLVKLDVPGSHAADQSVGGYVILEITDNALIHNPSDWPVMACEPYPEDGIKNILINDISLSINDLEGEPASTDDYEFKSYVNKKVATDFEEITLKCISANEEQAPVGKANMLKKVDNHYELQLSFTRAEATEILERLLMRTIHSNFATKNEKITVDIKMPSNPALSFTSYQPILSGEYLVVGCRLDFQRAQVTLTAVEYSADVANLSSLPYYD